MCVCRCRSCHVSRQDSSRLDKYSPYKYSFMEDENANVCGIMCSWRMFLYVFLSQFDKASLHHRHHVYMNRKNTVIVIYDLQLQLFHQVEWVTWSWPSLKINHCYKICWNHFVSLGLFVADAESEMHLSMTRRKLDDCSGWQGFVQQRHELLYSDQFNPQKAKSKTKLQHYFTSFCQ